MADAAKNMGASVRARLLAHARKNQQTFETVLTRYALERLLYRLAQTEHGERFVLKGAMLLMTWLEIPLRATRDLDFLAFGEPSPEGMLQVFKTVLSHGVDDDGVTFDAEALTVDRIREGVSYGGLRLQTWANVGGARVRVAIDIGFGDAVEPGVEEVEYPTLLDLPAPRLRTYARETVIAEKFQAMVALGRANTRMTAAVNDCVREVARFRTGAGPTITAEEITAARGEGTQWDAVNAVAREKGGHIEKLAFARMIVDRCVEPQDGELAEAVTTYLAACGNYSRPSTELGAARSTRRASRSSRR